MYNLYIDIFYYIFIFIYIMAVSESSEKSICSGIPWTRKS